MRKVSALWEVLVILTVCLRLGQCFVRISLWDCFGWLIFTQFPVQFHKYSLFIEEKHPQTFPSCSLVQHWPSFTCNLKIGNASQGVSWKVVWTNAKSIQPMKTETFTWGTYHLYWKMEIPVAKSRGSCHCLLWRLWFEAMFVFYSF